MGAGFPHATLSYGMIQYWSAALDCLFPFPVTGMGNFVEGKALHLHHQTVKFI